MEKEAVKLKKGAMQLLDIGSHVSVKFAEGDTKTPILEMTAYSGGVIKGHWYWGDLVIDLAGMSFPKKKFPILGDHMTNSKIGFATKMSTEDNKLTVAEATFVDTPESLQFRETSSQGFPYEASIYAQPSQIQTLAEKEVADVNGFQMKGPGTIWRKSVFKEASVCTFGYDSNTQSRAMAESEDVVVEITDLSKASKFKKEENTLMDRLKFKTEHPEEFAALVTELTTPMIAKFTEEKAVLETQIATLTAQNVKLQEENKDNGTRLIALEKAEMIRAEQSLRYSANTIFAEKFKASELPERLSDKLRKLVDHEAFIKDGVLDTEAFGAAVELELKDWLDEDGKVLGFSSVSKETVSNDKSDKLAEDAADRMLKYVK